ncbi:MAG: NAD(P)-binding domain-containing protein [Planctomycetes bacterium]|nr:NAD(P)-binding domain-containing protein [Planctomycetota bacterium]
MLTTLLVGTALAVVIITILGVYLSLQAERREEAALAETRAMGLNIPVSLHPVINLETCIGSGACVDACPESVLGRPGGVTQLITAAGCIGHGRCHDSCPVDAIALVFGTEERGVDIPLLKAGYETNVDGVFIIGELGGMGLIRNTMRQGVTAIRTGVAASLKNPEIVAGPGSDLVDVVIVGAGPAGIAAALECTHKKLTHVLLEQFSLGGSVTHYPRRKLVHTERIKLPIVGNFGKTEMLKEELVAEFERVCLEGAVNLLEHRRVTGVEGSAGDFRVACAIDGGEEIHRGRTVVLAIGRRGTPRRLGCPGEELSHVIYRLLDPEQFRQRRVLCVGGGDSSVEAAIALAGIAGCEVHLSYRNEAFYRVKKKNRDQLEAAVERGKIRLHLETTVKQITPDRVVLTGTEGEKTLLIDDIIINVGGLVPTKFLEAIGIEVETKYGEGLDGKKRRGSARRARSSTRLPPSTRLRKKSRSLSRRKSRSSAPTSSSSTSSSSTSSSRPKSSESVLPALEQTAPLEPLPAGDGLKPDLDAPRLGTRRSPRADLPLGLAGSDLGSLPLHPGDSEPFENESEDLR